MTKLDPSSQGKSPEERLRRARFGPYEADFDSQELRKQGTKLKVSGQPLQILEMLVERPGKLVSRADLQTRLWPDGVFVDSNHGLNAAVNKLRDALCDTAEEPKFIETLPRRGYRFIGALDTSAPTENAVQPSPLPGLVISAPALDSPIEKRQAHSGNEKKVSGRWALALSACAGLVLGAVTAGGFLQWEPMLSSPAAAPIRLEWDGPNAEYQRKRAAEKYVVRTAEVAYTARRRPAESGEGTVQLTPTLRTVVSGNSGYAAPQFSPDEKRIAFMSNRTGPWEIWVSGADGSRPVQVSFTESAGTPRWSPDGRTIAFDGPTELGDTDIFVVPADGSQRAHDLVEGFVPSFSRDGKWIYFASERSGEWQVWKVSVRGGLATQVTTQGGFAALESVDGNLYYSKSRYPNPKICRMPVRGGEETCGFVDLRPRTWSSWAVTRSGIVFAEDLPNGQTSLSLYDPARRQVRDLTPLRSAPFWVGASADGKRAIMNDAAERQISMVENLQ